MRRAEIRTAEGKLALDAHPHLFRHQLGTSTVNDNIPLTVIQELLDHGSIEMTPRYARLRAALDCSQRQREELGRLREEPALAHGRVRELELDRRARRT